MCSAVDTDGWPLWRQGIGPDAPSLWWSTVVLRFLYFSMFFFYMGNRSGISRNVYQKENNSIGYEHLLLNSEGFATIQLRSTSCFRARAWSLSLPSVRDVEWFHQWKPSSTGWALKTFKKPALCTSFLQICADGQRNEEQMQLRETAHLVILSWCFFPDFA